MSIFKKPRINFRLPTSEAERDEWRSSDPDSYYVFKREILKIPEEFVKSSLLAMIPEEWRSESERGLREWDVERLQRAGATDRNSISFDWSHWDLMDDPDAVEIRMLAFLKELEEYKYRLLGFSLFRHNASNSDWSRETGKEKIDAVLYASPRLGFVDETEVANPLAPPPPVG